MNALKKLREALGISQAEMAGLLGLEKGRIAMAETGKRSLPSEARMVVAWMLDELDGWTDASEPVIFNAETIRKEIRKLEARLENLKLKLENKEVKEQKAGFLEFICKSFESQFPNQIPILAKQNISLLLAIEDLRKDKEQANAPIFLQTKIKGIESEIAFLKANL